MTQRKALKDSIVIVLLTTGATGLRWLFNPVLGFRSPLLLHILAVALAAQIAGTVAGLVVTGLSVVLIDYFFIPPLHTFGPPPNAGDNLALLLFVLVGAFLSFRAGERKHAADELRRIRYNLETAQQIANIGSWESDLVGRLWWSPQTYAIFGVESDGRELRSDEFYQLVHPDDREKVREAVNRAVAAGTDYEVEHRIVRRKDGEVRDIHQRAKVVRDGGSLQLIGSIEDVTDKRRGEAAQEILGGLLQVCSACRRIRDNEGGAEWYSMEGYLRLHSTARFSHGMCPDCTKQWSSERRDGAGMR